VVIAPERAQGLELHDRREMAGMAADATEGLRSVNEFPTRGQPLMEILFAIKLRRAAALATLLSEPSRTFGRSLSKGRVCYALRMIPDFKGHYFVEDKKPNEPPSRHHSVKCGIKAELRPDGSIDFLNGNAIVGISGSVELDTLLEAPAYKWPPDLGHSVST
jgi:hypothetical protein